MGKVWIAFERDKGLVPWLIRKFTRFDYNHVLFVFESSEWDALWAAESVSRHGVRVVPVLPHRVLRDRFMLKFDVWPALREHQLLITQPYDLLSLFVQGFKIFVTSVLRLRLSLSGVSLKGQNCSEWIAEVLRDRFSIEFEAPQWVTPRGIFELMRKRPDDFEREAV